MGCCGRGSGNGSSSGAGSGSPSPLLPGRDGMILLEYVGTSAGDMTYYGSVSSSRYYAGGVHKRIFVDKRDAPGLLDMIEGRKPVFRVVPVKAGKADNIVVPKVDAEAVLG